MAPSTLIVETDPSKSPQSGPGEKGETNLQKDSADLPTWGWRACKDLGPSLSFHPNPVAPARWLLSEGPHCQWGTKGKRGCLGGQHRAKGPPVIAKRGWCSPGWRPKCCWEQHRQGAGSEGAAPWQGAPEVERPPRAAPPPWGKRRLTASREPWGIRRPLELWQETLVALAGTTEVLD